MQLLNQFITEDTYIDGIFILWPHPEADLKKFLLHMNTLHTSIKFTSEYGSKKIAFLDVTVYKGPNFIATNKLGIETFIKPTNKKTYRYIHAKSFHPPGVSKGLAIGEMKRFVRTNSRMEAFNHKFKASLKRRGYSPRLINSYTNRVKFLDRLLELQPKTNKKKPNKLCLTTRFSTSAKAALAIVKKTLAFNIRTEMLQKYFNSFPNTRLQNKQKHQIYVSQ